ncbi:MAG: orotate phosphoribosyltransferase [Ignisphaera sp.]|uniref:Orotate phosphoribosyltransferase n=1 Tax=Ignisphaera aggregans TaxID=334771 RepID=A0A7C4NLL0_9CREN
MSWLAIELYKHGIIKLGRFRLTSGLESPYYIDLRQLYSYPDVVEKLVNELILLANLDEYEVLVGIATSGIVLASFIACKVKRPLSYVRIEKKAHGTQALVEGNVKGKRCIIIDDVATTGGSIEHAYHAVKEAEGIPTASLVVIDREQGAKKLVERLGMKFYSYLKASDIFKHLYEHKLVNEEQYKELLNYISSSTT